MNRHAEGVRLLAQLARRGIEVRRDGYRLEVTADHGALTEEARAFISRHREALLVGLASPPRSTPSWPPHAVEAAVVGRVEVLREAGLSTVAAERQAADDVLALDIRGVPSHQTATCSLHGLPLRRLPNRDAWRCPACLPGAFAQPPTAGAGRAA
jgi:hypothetical protein